MKEYFQKFLNPSRQTDAPFSDPLDWFLFIITLIIGTGFFLYIDRIGLSLYLVDQFSHLSMARQITDSLTPGMSQVGFWPPLLHVLMAPLAAFDALFFTGYAAPLLLIPVLGLAVVLLARTIYLLTDDRVISYCFAPVLLVNPYILYFAVTPMMEVLFIAMLLGTAYSFAHWWITGRFASLVMTAVFVSLATIARFEGFVLLPLLGAGILVKLLNDRRSRAEIEAVAILFSLVATTGLVFTLIYGYIYNDDPLAFASNNWGAYAQQRDLTLPGEHNIKNAFIYMGAAAKEMLGTAPLVGLIAGATLLFLTLLRNRLLTGVVILILVSPFLFDILAVFQGSAIIYVPYLPPHPDGYFNARYGLFLAAAGVLVPALCAALFARITYRPHQALPVHLLPGSYVLMFLFVGAVTFATVSGCPSCFDPVRLSQQKSPPDHAPAAEALHEAYTGGFILMTRALHNEIAVRAGIPLKNYILEANEHYYDRAIETPWLYARYVVMFRPSEDIHQPWQRENEEISKIWAGSEDFLYFYEEIFTSDAEAVYVLRTDALQEFVSTHHLPEDAIPSLNPQMKRWDVEGTHARIETAMKQWREREMLRQIQSETIALSPSLQHSTAD